jgi:hypothetical protein
MNSGPLFQCTYKYKNKDAQLYMLIIWLVHEGNCFNQSSDRLRWNKLDHNLCNMIEQLGLESFYTYCHIQCAYTGLAYPTNTNGFSVTIFGKIQEC